MTVTGLCRAEGDIHLNKAVQADGLVASSNAGCLSLCASILREKSRGFFEYRPGEGGRAAPKKRATIGRASDFTPDQARKIADNIRSAVKTGQDPQSEKRKQRSALTVAELAEAFLAQHVNVKRRNTTAAHYEDILRRLVIP